MELLRNTRHLGLKHDTSLATAHSSIIDRLLDMDGSGRDNCFETFDLFWQLATQSLSGYTSGHPVSPKAAEAALLILSMKDVCAEFPLFNIPAFFRRLRTQHTAETCNSPSWWASLNSLVALTAARRISRTSFHKVSVIAWAFFNNAYAILPSILQEPVDFQTAQSLLTMAMFTRSSADVRTTMILLSNACRIIQITCLPTRCGTKSEDLATRETIKRVFWVAFILEAEICSTCGIPLLLAKDHAEFDLPSESSRNGHEIVAPEGDQTSVSIFRHRAELAIIQSRVHKKLYSTKSLTLGASKLLLKSRLQCELNEWLSKVPSIIRPKPDNVLTQSMEDMTALRLHFVYFNCASMVYWTAHRAGPDQVAVESMRQCNAAARSTISLLNCVTDFSTSELWQASRDCLFLD